MGRESPSPPAAASLLPFLPHRAFAHGGSRDRHGCHRQRAAPSTTSAGIGGSTWRSPTIAGIRGTLHPESGRPADRKRITRPASRSRRLPRPPEGPAACWRGCAALAAPLPIPGRWRFSCRHRLPPRQYRRPPFRSPARGHWRGLAFPPRNERNRTVGAGRRRGSACTRYPTPGTAAARSRNRRYSSGFGTR